MSNVLSVATVIEANRLSSDVPFLCLVDVEIVDPNSGTVVQILRIVRNTEPVTFQDEVYEAGSFDIEVKSETGKSAEVSLTVIDYTRAIESQLEAYGGGIGSNVTLYVVPADGLDRPPESEEHFLITGASAANYQVTFVLGAENALARPYPPRRQTRDFCQWRFKDPLTCRYAGTSTSCDLSLKGPNGCAAHQNTINFGGQPGINSNGRRYA